ncbi:MAG: hypothetical protein BGO12_05785 [Verrucomicrobia bacterium 61-8]|nr:hypothetical protein [Verrucomicrobiota bacterium]OJV02155.1 MAG: hypothetical protein BGO12_05785 [Verrucomicrobia bacterium 61-8]
MKSVARLLALSLAHAGMLQAAPVQVSIPWEQPWPVVTPAAAGKFGFVLKNKGAEPAAITFQATLRSPSGKEESISNSLTVPAGEEGLVPCSFAGREFGCWQIDYAFRQEADPASDVAGKVALGFLDPAGPNETTPAFRFGIVAHSERVSAKERITEMEAAAFIGAKVLRSNPEWSMIQPEAGQWDWKVADEMVATAERLHMEIQFLLAFTPRWAAAPGLRDAKDWLSWNRSAPDPAAWSQYVTAASERYKGRIHLWEIWNEPDLDGFWRGSTEEYLATARLAVDILRRTDPGNLILSGGFGTLTEHGARKTNPDLQARVMMAMGDQFDYHAIHEHGPFHKFAQVVDGDYKKLRAALPGKVPPIFFNETSDYATPGKENEQAHTLIKKATFAYARGAAGYLWYDLRNDGTDPRNPEHNFGLLTRKMAPKPAYLAFNTVAREVVSRPYLRQLDLGESRWFFLFGDEQEKLLVYWNDDEGSQNEQVLLHLAEAGKAELIDFNGNSSPLPLVNHQIVIPASKEPRFLKVHGGGEIRPAGKLAGPSRAFFGAPGEEIVVDCEFQNPSDQPAEVRVKWATPSAIKVVSPAPEKISLAPNGRATAALKVRLPEGASYRYGADANLKMTYAFEGIPYEGSMLVPVHYGTIAVPADRPGRDPDFVLEKREQLFSFVEADPNMVQYRWRGPDDLSVRAWFAVDPDDLVLRVAVTDDRHAQENTAADMWKADSVQCALVLPGQQGEWEFGFAENSSGQPLTMLWNRPDAVGKEEFLARMKVDVERKGEGRVYTVRLPRQEMGLTDERLRAGFRFNMAVNDSDGKVRAHALQLAPGIVDGKSINSAPYVVFKELPSPDSQHTAR